MQEEKVKKLLKSRKSIAITNGLIKALGFDDVRDFTKSLGDYGYTTDFTYRDKHTEDFQTHLRGYLKYLIAE